MPGIQEKKPEIAGAICGPPATENHSNGVQSAEVPQPRQPSNLQGLLRFAMEATRSEDAPSEPRFASMDEERKRFLDEALKSLTVNVTEVLQIQIDILKDVSNVKATDDASKYVQALETVLEYVDQIDIANDFHKMGGFAIIKPCMACENPEVRGESCQLVAELCQNNPYCQKVAIENEYIPLLLDILEKDEDDQVIVKALNALSAIVRHNSEAFSLFITYKGFEILKRVLLKKQEKCITKVTFLLGTLCRTQPDIKSRLVFLGYLPILISILSDERKPSHEHVLSFLMSLVEDHPSALKECKDPQYNLKEVLEIYLGSIRNKDECLEEEEYCRRLLHMVFGIN